MMESERNVVDIHVFYKCPWQRRQSPFLNEGRHLLEAHTDLSTHTLEQQQKCFFPVKVLMDLRRFTVAGDDSESFI